MRYERRHELARKRTIRNVIAEPTWTSNLNRQNPHLANQRQLCHFVSCPPRPIRGGHRLISRRPWPTSSVAAKQVDHLKRPLAMAEKPSGATMSVRYRFCPIGITHQASGHRLAIFCAGGRLSREADIRGKPAICGVAGDVSHCRKAIDHPVSTQLTQIPNDCKSVHSYAKRRRSM